MAEPRKVFRIEKTVATRLVECREPPQEGLRHVEILRELAALRAMLAAATRGETGKANQPRGETLRDETWRLASELHLIHDAVSGNAAELGSASASPRPAAQMTRIAHELDAVMEGSEQATQKILAAAEEIDQVANNLSPAINGRIEQGLVQDIQDLVIRIFEACNFQDLTSQRITKVMTTLNFIEAHIARVLHEIEAAPQPADAAQLLHGPRLATDRGHVSQSDVDALFGASGA